MLFFFFLSEEKRAVSTGLESSGVSGIVYLNMLLVGFRVPPFSSLDIYFGIGDLLGLCFGLLCNSVNLANEIPGLWSSLQLQEIRVSLNTARATV